MEYLDSISPAGWGKLLSTFLPTSLAIFIADLIAYVIIPLLILLFLISFFKKRNTIGGLGAWRSCGKQWIKIGAVFIIVNIVLYFIYNSVLTTSISGVRSLQDQYREDMLGAKSTKDHNNIQNIARQLRNAKRKPATVVNENKKPVTSGGILDEESNVLSNKKKLTEDEIVANLDSDVATEDNGQTTVQISSKEYQVVDFFYKGYSWLHHMFYAIAWIIFACWFFWPGLKMQKQKTIIKN